METLLRGVEDLIKDSVSILTLSESALITHLETLNYVGQTIIPQTIEFRENGC